MVDMSIDDKVEKEVHNLSYPILGATKYAMRLGLPYFLTAVGIMIGLEIWTYSDTKSLLKQEHDKCFTIDNKTLVRDTSLGEYSCNQIEERYDLFFKE